MPRSPPWTDLHQICHSRRGRRRNHLYQFFWWSVKGCGFCGGSKIAISHWQSKSPLTQGWRYRAARDLLWSRTCLCHHAVKTFQFVIPKIRWFNNWQFPKQWLDSALASGVPNIWHRSSYWLCRLCTRAAAATVASLSVDVGEHLYVLQMYCIAIVHFVILRYRQVFSNLNSSWSVDND